jgi:hypothetical protein
MAAAILVNPEFVQFGIVGELDEFWLIKVKDKYAAAASRVPAGHGISSAVA